jgi:hypothetical protein
MRQRQTNSAEVLKHFNDGRQAKRNAMMTGYTDYMQTGGQSCGKPKKCKKKSGRRGGKLKNALRVIGGGLLTAGAVVAGNKALNKLKNKN